MQHRAVPLAAALVALAATAVVVADDLRPPLVGMKEHMDEKQVVSIQLPVNWRDESLPTHFGAVWHWSGFFQPPKPDGPDANLEVAAKPTWSRVELAFWDEHITEVGKPVDGTIRRGDGWIEEVRREEGKQRYFLTRMVESHGQVFQVTAWSHETIYPSIDNHLRALFDTFKVNTAWTAFTPPEGYAMSTVAGTTVWTDTKDKKTLGRMLDAHAATWKAMSQWLPGARAIADPPVVVVCDKDAVYSELAALASPGQTPACFHDYQRRMFCTRVASKTDATLDRSLHESAALQYLQLYFGGKSPDWVDWGLGTYAMITFESKGKAEKPTNEYVRLAKESVAAHPERFDGILVARRMNMTDAEYEHFDTACYAWHCFFRFGAGVKPYGDRYTKYLAELRKSGSPDEAAKAFAGVDHDKLAADFKAWVAAWK